MKIHKRLPEFRTARAEGFLVNERLETKKALLGGYVGHILAVSHRWDDKVVPDYDGSQLTALCDYLNSDEGKAIKYVFYDYSCMPQGERDEEEERFFKNKLLGMSLLYLGCTVLVMLERSSACLSRSVAQRGQSAIAIALLMRALERNHVGWNRSTRSARQPEKGKRKRKPVGPARKRQGWGPLISPGQQHVTNEHARAV